MPVVSVRPFFAFVLAASLFLAFSNVFTHIVHCANTQTFTSLSPLVFPTSHFCWSFFSARFIANGIAISCLWRPDRHDMAAPFGAYGQAVCYAMAREGRFLLAVSAMDGRVWLAGWRCEVESLPLTFFAYINTLSWVYNYNVRALRRFLSRAFMRNVWLGLRIIAGKQVEALRCFSLLPPHGCPSW